MTGRVKVAQTIKLLKRIAFGCFGGATLVLALAPARSPWPLPLLAFGFSLLALLALLLLYNKSLASWRAALCSWLAYLAWRALSAWLAGGRLSLAWPNVALLALVFSLEAMIAALAAILVLAIRRDVSVAYVALAYGLGAWLMLLMVRSSGGVMGLLERVLTPGVQPGFALFEPALISLPCMATLGFLSFIPHLLWLIYRESRGH